MKIWFRCAFVLCLLTLPATAAFARKHAASTAPGKYTDWDGEMDELEVISTFKLADYKSVVVETFDTSSTPLPEKNDNTYGPAQYALAHATLPFKDGLAGQVQKPVASGEPGTKAEAGELLVRGKVTEMDPGSQAARYWAGFGAGAARTEITGEVVDGATGAVLLRFKQQRRSGVGALGGSYGDLLDRNLITIGEDLGNVLRHF
ncbi:MAG: DUF4410 domain-containing protein [Thermoanaerobaculia bacterium]